MFVTPPPALTLTLTQRRSIQDLYGWLAGRYARDTKEPRMHIATVKPHPTDPDFVIVGVASVLNPIMGRFEPARLSTQHKGYLVHADNIDALIRFLRLENIAVSDSRPTAASNGPPQFHRKPSIVLKCANCDYTQRDRGTCNRCGAATLGDHIVTVEEQIDINRRGMAKVKAAAAGQPWENLP